MSAPRQGSSVTAAAASRPGSPARRARSRRTGAADSVEDAAARRLAAIIGHGAQGAALARALAREGVRTRAGLKRPDILARLPRESQASVLYSPARNVPLATARAVMDEVRRRLVFSLDSGGGARPRRFGVLAVGSVRREAPRVKDMDFLVVIPPAYEARLDDVLAAATLRPPRGRDRVAIVDTYASGPRHRSLILRLGGARAQYFRSDLFLATAAEKPYALFHYTGSKGYNIRTRAHAKRKGWLLNQYGLFEAHTGQRVRGTAAVRTERELARFLGVTYRAPRARDEGGARAAPPAARRAPRPGRPLPTSRRRAT